MRTAKGRDGGSGDVTDARVDGEARTEAAFALVRAFFESLDVDQTWWRITKEAGRVFRHAQCVMFDYDHAANQLVAVAASGAGTERVVGQRISLADPNPSGEEAHRKRVIDASMLILDRTHAGLEEQLHAGTAVAMPLAVRGESIGLMLLICRDQEQAFYSGEIKLARELADLASCAIHNARVYRNALRSQGRLEAMLNRMSQAREQEHAAFAAMVHDDVLQAVVGTVYALDGLRYAVAEDCLPDFDRVIHMLRLSVEDARKIIWELRPAVLDGIGLTEALGAITDRIAVESAVAVSTSCSGVDGLNEGVTTALYKIGREALLNADRHAHATNIQLRLAPVDSVDGPAVSLIVSDNGVGFDATGDRQQGHYGLMMMEEQAAAIGGTLRVQSQLGEGTTLELTIPLARAIHAGPDVIAAGRGDDAGADHPARARYPRRS